MDNNYYRLSMLQTFPLVRLLLPHSKMKKKNMISSSSFFFRYEELLISVEREAFWENVFPIQGEKKVWQKRNRNKCQLNPLKMNFQAIKVSRLDRRLTKFMLAFLTNPMTDWFSLSLFRWETWEFLNAPAIEERNVWITQPSPRDQQQ